MKFVTWNQISRYVREEYFPIRILDKYLFSEFIRTLMGTAVMLTSVMMISLVMDNMRNFVSSKEHSYHIYLFLAYSIPKMFSWVMAPSLMFAVCFVVGQFSVNKELVSSMAAGVSFYRFVSPLIFFGILMWFLTLAINETIVRPLNKLAQNEHSLILKGTGSVTDLVYQYHVKGKEGFYYVYFYDAKEKAIKGGFNYIRMNENGLPLYVISALSAKYSAEYNHWRLKTIEEITFDEDFKIKSREMIPEKIYTFPETAEHFSKPNLNVEEMNFFQLGEEIQVRKEKGLPYGDLSVERHSIFATPVMCVIVVIIGAIMGGITTKSAGVASLGITIAVVLLYYIFYSAGRSLGESAGVPAFLAIWTTPVFFLSVCIFLYKKFNL